MAPLVCPRPCQQPLGSRAQAPISSRRPAHRRMFHCSCHPASTGSRPSDPKRAPSSLKRQNLPDKGHATPRRRCMRTGTRETQTELHPAVCLPRVRFGDVVSRTATDDTISNKETPQLQAQFRSSRIVVERLSQANRVGPCPGKPLSQSTSPSRNTVPGAQVFCERKASVLPCSKMPPAVFAYRYRLHLGLEPQPLR